MRALDILNSVDCILGLISLKYVLNLTSCSVDLATRPKGKFWGLKDDLSNQVFSLGRVEPNAAVMEKKRINLARWRNNWEESLPSIWFCETVQKTTIGFRGYLWSFFDVLAIRWLGSKKGQPRTIYHGGEGRREEGGINDSIIWEAVYGKFNSKQNIGFLI